MATSMPTLTVTGQEIYDAIAPLMQASTPGYSDAENGYFGAILSGALATMVDPVADVVRDQSDGTPGYAILFDPQKLVDNGMEQWLPWVAQFVGDSQAVLAAPDTATQLAILQEPFNFTRGRPATLEAAARTALTGTQKVFLEQFVNGDPNRVSISTYTNETAAPQRVVDAVMSVMPAWIVGVFGLLQPDSYAVLPDTYATYSALKSTFTSYSALAANPAG